MNSSDITIKLRERFCKDTNIPINIFIEPYFSERLDYIDKVLPEKNYEQKWLNFLSMLKDFDNEQDYFEYYNNVKEQAIQFIKNSQGYQNFNNEDMNKYKCNISETHKNLVKSIYQDQFIGDKTYISIDICKANFNCLRKYNKGIFNNALTWEDFLKNFTDYKYILDSKYIRQVVLGNCNPGRVITYETYIASLICKKVEEYVPSAKLICFTTDEVIFDIPELDRHLFLNAFLEINKLLDVKIKIDIFSLSKINGDFQGYIRHLYKDYGGGNYVEDHREYKGLEGNFAYLIIKVLNKDKITDNDLVFEFEKKCYCKLISLVYIEEVKNVKAN